MDEKTGQASDIAQAASEVRARVEEALKGTIEHELIRYDPAVMGFSKFEHVVSPVEEEVEADSSLASSLWGEGDDERVRAFAERLTKY